MKVSMMFQTGSGSTELNEAAQQKVADYMQQRVGDMTCPDHGEAPTIVCSGTHLDNLQFDVRACCQKMVLKVKEKLAE